MTNEIQLAISPCPNDTYIFYALLKGEIDTSPYKINYTLDDIQVLNQSAVKARPDVVKISVAAYPYVNKSYRLIRSGGALGWGCGPVLVARQPESLAGQGTRIAIPGRLTTAALLFKKYGLACKEVIEMRYDRILPAVAEGQVEAGVVIHEGRMTYQNYNLHKIVDLGQWWEETTGLPIPLGIIVVKRDLGQDFSDWIEAKIQESLALANSFPEKTWPFIREKAQEMDESIIRSHIDNFVTDYSYDMGDQGLKTIDQLNKPPEDC